MLKFLYAIARLFNDITKYSSGSPKKIVKRQVNKQIGKRVVSKLWLR